MAQSESQTNRPTATGIARLQMPSLVVGLIAAAVTVVGIFISGPQAFYRSYLPSWLFWFEIVAGCLGVLMLQYVTGGEWGVLVRRPLAAAARTMLVMAVLFLPIAIGIEHIYIWANHEAVANDHLLHAKEPWLNPTRWWIAAAIYFGVWMLWAWRIRFLSLDFAKTRSPFTELKRRKWSAAGLLMIVLTMTLCSIDWMMSLEPHWFSSMYGISFTVGCGLSAIAFVTFFLTRLADTKAMANILRPSHLRDLGNLMLAFTMLWAYTAFSQFLLIWYANVKEEVPYYLKRQHGTWGLIAIALIVFHFFMPFFMLLMRSIKDRANTIAAVTVVILAMRYVDLYWLTAPAFYGEHFSYHWMGLTSLIAIGGIWMFFFIGQLKGQSIIPIHETWVEEAIREGALTNA